MADYALLALDAGAYARLADEACRGAAKGLGAPQAKLLQYRPESDEFRVLSAVGSDGSRPDRRLGAGPRSPAGHAFRTGKPVLCGAEDVFVGDAERGGRPFRLPRQLLERGVRSAIVVPIGSGIGKVWGVLEVDSPRDAAFGSQDVAFLRALSNILAAGRDAHSRRAELGRSEGFAAAVLDACPDCVEVLDEAGRITRINGHGLLLLELDRTEARLGLAWVEQWPQEARAAAERALAVARVGGTGRFAACRPRRNGSMQWWDVLIAPMPTGAFVVVARDATRQVLADAAKDGALREKDLLMVEVHHRVKNSLQMVQNLLSLQARASGDVETGRTLEESAARVRTISAIHNRLYRAGATLDVEIGPYLEGLIEDLQAALVGSVADRRISLTADAACWPASEVPTLGLVLTELVTNSLKYGAGTVGVSFRQPAGQPATLIVEDEGPGPEPGFDASTSPGLGMRLVAGLLRGGGAGLEIDRSTPHARFIARLPHHT